MKKTEYIELWSKFWKIFHRNLNDFVEMIMWNPEFDLFKFEEFLNEKGYESWSMCDFVKSKYGEDAEKLIRYLLK